MNLTSRKTQYFHCHGKMTQGTIQRWRGSTQMIPMTAVVNLKMKQMVWLKDNQSKQDAVLLKII